jgi:hypothetical protein
VPFVPLPDDVAQPPDWRRRPMESWWKDEESTEAPEVLLRQIGRNAFQLLDGFAYELPGNDGLPPAERRTFPAPRHDVTKGPRDGDNSTDLASVPSFLWWFIASYGRHTRAALLHDHLVDREEYKGQADAVFRSALAESRVRFFRRWLMWTAVSLNTLRRSRRGTLAILGFAVHLAAFATAFGFLLYSAWPFPWLTARARGVWSVFPDDAFQALSGAVTWAWSMLVDPWLPEEWVWSMLERHPLGSVAVLGVAGAVWGWKWPLALVGTALIGLPTLFVWTSIGFTWLLDFTAAVFGWLLRRSRGIDCRFERPELGPTTNQANRF